MNSFETDLKRAIVSKRFFLGVMIQSMILVIAGPKADVFYMSMPIFCALPCSCIWLNDYQSGYLKLYLIRTSKHAYSMGKVLSCALSGGSVTMCSGWIYQLLVEKEERIAFNVLLFGLSGMVWALVAAIMAAWSESKCVSYGGGFVCFYFLVILQERFVTRMYCINPIEWLIPEHAWVMGEQGVAILVVGVLWILMILYYMLLRRCVECL